MKRVGLNRTIETESSPREKRVKKFPWHLCHSSMEHGKSLNKVMKGAWRWQSLRNLK